MEALEERISVEELRVATLAMIAEKFGTRPLDAMTARKAFKLVVEAQPPAGRFTTEMFHKLMEGPDYTFRWRKEPGGRVLFVRNQHTFSTVAFYYDKKIYLGGYMGGKGTTGTLLEAARHLRMVR